MKRSTPLFLVLFFLLCATGAMAQGLEDNNWFFGNSSEAIRFNKSNNNPSLVNSQSTPFGSGGSAVATDPITGNLLFYTDGERVYDASHRLMPNGDGLGSLPSLNQAAAISPVPGMPGQFYIFSNNSAITVPNVLVSIVDMNLSGNAGTGEPPLGEVVQKNVETGALSSSDAMIVLRGNDPETWMLLIQDNDAIKIYNVQNTLPFAGAANSIPELQIIAGSFVYNQDNNTIAVVPKNENANIKIYKFDPSTGGLTAQDTIQNSGRSGEFINDAAWSPDGTTLFFSRSSIGNAVTGQIYQYHEGLSAPQPVLETPVFGSYGLATGPDGKIYHLHQAEKDGIYRLGSINNPNETDSLTYSSWQETVNFNGKYFPQFVSFEPFLFEQVSFQPIDTCANSRTKFIPTVRPQADSLVWQIADSSFNTISPEFTFEQGGLVPVSLTAYLHGVGSTYSRDVTIKDNNLQISLVSDTTVCATAFPGFSLTAEVEGGSGGEQLVWSHGQTGATATFDSTGTYYVVAETADGCKTYASVNIKICQEEKRVGNIWFFGDRAGIDFNPEMPEAIPGISEMNAPAGASAISDRNGQILFYTDGATIWNKDHEIMLNGNDIGGDPLSTQSALVVPFPGDATKYYVFTTDVANGDQTYDLRYSIVDIMADGTRGAVEPTSKASLLFSRSTEKITAVESSDTTWLLAHELGNNTFRAYPISSSGIGAPVLSSEGSDHPLGTAGNAKGYMKFSSDGSRVAAAVQGPPSFVELFSFDDSTGTVSNPIKIDFSSEMPYGIEFSPDNRKLYISTSSALYQYHISDTLSNEQVLASKKQINLSASTGLGALQLGPNGQIYLAQDGAGQVLVVNSPNTLETDTSHVSVNTFDLEGATSRLGLPNFVQSIMEPISDGDFTFEGQCLGEETQFTAMGRCDTDQFEWIIKNAQNRVLFRSGPSKNTDLSFEFPEPGTYDVSLIISNPCAIPSDTTITKDVVIAAPPAEPDFPAVIGLCNESEILTAGPVSDELEYLWSTGERTNEIAINRPGPYFVIITNTITGCSTRYETRAERAGLEVDLGDDAYYCQGERELFLDAGRLGSSFAWEVFDMSNGSLVSTGARNRMDISTATPGTFKYKVTVTSPEPFNCVTKDSVLITINPAPTGVAQGSTIASCSNVDGTIDLNINSTGNYSYEVFDANNNLMATEPSVNGPATSIEAATGLGAGLYYVMLTDNVSGCSTRVNASIETSDVDQFTIAPIVTVQADCHNEADVEIVTDGVGPVDYIVSGTTSEGSPYYITNDGQWQTFTVEHVPAGTFAIEVTDANGCKATAEFTVLEASPIPLEIDGEQEVCPDDGNLPFIQILNANSGEYLYTWTNDDTGDQTGIVPNTASTAIRQFDLPGTYRVTASLISDPTCSRDTVFQIYPSPQPVDVSFETGPDCMGQQTITANVAGSGNYNFLWSPGNRIGRTITVTESRSYAVTVYENGCIVGSGNISVTVNPEVRVTLSSEAACGEDEMIRLYADVNVPNPIYTWRDDEGHVLEQGTNLGIITVANSGTYHVTVGRNTCEASASITVQKNPVGFSTLPETSVIICPSSADPRRSEVHLNPDSLNVFTRFRWERDGEFVSSERIIKPQFPGLYKVTMTNIDGCIVEDEIRVTLSCEPIIFVPNAIRPDSHISENRTFKIFTEDNIAEDGFQVYIFNRWGELVFQSKDKNFEWDGTFKGKPVPVSAFSYVIYYKGAEDPSGEIHQLQGGVTVLR